MKCVIRIAHNVHARTHPYTPIHTDILYTLHACLYLKSTLSDISRVFISPYLFLSLSHTHTSTPFPCHLIRFACTLSFSHIYHLFFSPVENQATLAVDILTCRSRKKHRCN